MESLFESETESDTRRQQFAICMVATGELEALNSSTSLGECRVHSKSNLNQTEST